jgi:3D (Asp-Asp-Asp) domain-containing protein
MGLLFLTGTGNAETKGTSETFITHTVAMTGYNAVPEQTDEDPMTTASGAYSNPEIIVARSVDLADDLPFGTVIEVTANSATSTTCGLSLVEEHIGYRVVADSMHPRKRAQIDILFDTEHSVKVGGKQVNAARALGVCKGVEVRVVGEVDIKHIPRDQAELKRVVEEQRLALRG